MLKAIDGAEAPSSVDRVAFGAQMWKKGYGRLPAFGLPTAATADTKEPDWYWNTLANPSSPFWQDPKYPRRQIDHDYALAHRLFWRTQTTSFPALDWVASKVTGHNVRITTDDLGRALKAGLPLVQTVISFVPGIGAGVNMAIAAGGALLAGESISDAAIASVKSALPGGPAAAYAFDAATKVMKGERLDRAALESARNLLPPGAAQQAFDIGIAVASGQKIQDIVGKSIAAIAPGQIQSVLSDAHGVIENNTALASAFQQIPAGAAEQGFKLAAGLLKKDANTTNTKTMAEVREQLPPDVQAGFDAAMKAASPPPPPAATPTTSTPSMRKLSPEEIKRIQANVKAAADMAALAKLTPEQQKQLVEAAAAEKAKLEASKTAPPKMATPPKVIPKTAAPATPAAPTATAPKPSAASPASTTTAAPARSPSEYGPYPPPAGAVHGLGFAWGNSKWRWFVVQANGKTIAQRGPVWLSDDAAVQEEISFRESMIGRGYIGTVTRWDWTGSNWQKSGAGALSAPPQHSKGWGGGGGKGHGGHGGGHGGHPHGGRPFVNRGRGTPGWWGPWYGTPYSPEITTVEMTCRTWGDPIEMPPAMMQAARMALGASSNRPTAVRGPDGVLYLFAFEGNGITARPCVASAAA